MEVKLGGVDRITKKLNRIARFHYISNAVKAGAETIINDAGKYPPASEANVPDAQGRWYQRGYGQRWASGGSRTSENLGKRWYVRASGKTSVIIGNMASYAVYVHGKVQARFHMSRGWKQLEKVAEEELPRITKAIQKEIGRIWR